CSTLNGCKLILDKYLFHTSVKFSQDLRIHGNVCDLCSLLYKSEIISELKIFGAPDVDGSEKNGSTVSGLPNFVIASSFSSLLSTTVIFFLLLLSLGDR